MEVKNNKRVRLCLLSILGIVIVSGLYLYLGNGASYPATIEEFLSKYYTVSTYKSIPNDVEAIDEIKNEYSNYLVPEEIERLISNRSILENSLAAEQAGCTLKVKKINIDKVPNEKQIYRYEVDVEANYSSNEQKNMTLTGQLYMEDDSKQSLILKHYPDLEQKGIFNLLEN